VLLKSSIRQITKASKYLRPVFQEKLSKILQEASVSKRVIDRPRDFNRESSAISD